MLATSEIFARTSGEFHASQVNGARLLDKVSEFGVELSQVLILHTQDPFP